MAIGQSEAVLLRPQGLLDARTVAGFSDGELLARFTADRDALAETAFAALVRRHGPMVLRVCQQILGDRHTAEDAFQATFLVLARRAGSIHQPELLGHWLHGVALRTAREARMRDHRRRQREALGVNGNLAEPTDETERPELKLACREEFEALHEEVSRLPERYRVPVVLCDLEGLTYQEAADRLRCPVGTIGVRLKRARQRLRVRLTHRGLAPTAGLIGAFLGANVASAHVPAALVDSTAQAALGFAASTALTTGLVSTSVVALSESVLKTMTLGRLKLGIGIAIAVGIAATSGWIGVSRHARVPASMALGKSIPRQEAPRPVVNAPAVHEKSEPARESRPPANPVLPEPAKVHPRHEALVPSNLLATAFAGRAIVSPAIGNSPDLAAIVSGGLFSVGRVLEEEFVKGSPGRVVMTQRISLARAERASQGELVWGKMLFAKEWAPYDSMSRGDGLGPVYNETSCVSCHGLGGPGGAGPDNKNVVIMTASNNSCGPGQSLDQIHPGFGSSRSAVLHRFGTDPAYASWRRRFLNATGNEQPNSASKRSESLVNARIRALKEQTRLDRRLHERSPAGLSVKGVALSLTERNTPALFGVGLIDEIPSEVLVAAAARQNSPIRGRVSRTKEGRIGRFGWKAQMATLHGFVRGACANEIGLEVPGHLQAKSPLAPQNRASGLDMNEQECDALVAYVRALPAPIAVDPSGPDGTEDIREGRRHFADVRCTSCHMPVLGEVRGMYSDLLLHDMGQSLSDSASGYGMNGSPSPNEATPREWRTPPLWGFRDSGPYMHDGRAQNLEEAVALHDGQSKKSAHAFFTLSAQSAPRSSHS